jgi:hypothetical protein
MNQLIVFLLLLFDVPKNVSGSQNTSNFVQVARFTVKSLPHLLHLIHLLDTVFCAVTSNKLEKDK